MLPLVSLRALGAALCLLPLTSAHMQMLTPSPFRDPHSDRDEPKDYNILTPLHADGSDFACKGYQWNTPWTTVATYEAGKSYKMTLKGSATHGGGSCQLSLSCDGGIKFKVIKSIIGGCPLQNEYPFTIPTEFAKTKSATCLFAWTWFNKIGNREMYMNCAVVEIVPKKTSGRRSVLEDSQTLNPRGIARANAAAQSALADYPDIFVANLKKVNGCSVKETMEVVFDDPGRSVSFANGASASSSPSFKQGVCRGSGLASTDSSAFSSTGSTGGWKESSNSKGQDWTWQGSDSSSQGGSSPQGNDGQWHGGDQAKQSSIGDDGQWHGDQKTQIGDNSQWRGGQTSSNAQQGVGTSNADAKQAIDSNTQNQQEKIESNLHPVDVSQAGQQPDAKVQSELAAYLEKLYGKSGKRAARDLDNESTKRAMIRIESHHGHESYGESDAEETLTDKVLPQEQADSHTLHDRLKNHAFSEDTITGTDYDLSDGGSQPRLRRSTRQQRWKSYSERRADPSTVPGEVSKDAEGSAADRAPAPPRTDASDAAILAKLESLGNRVISLLKFASNHLDSPPPGDYFFGSASKDGKSSSSSRTPEKKRDTPDEIVASGLSWPSILANLNSIQDRVTELIQFVKNKIQTSGATLKKIKRSLKTLVRERQLVIPGIIPATMQNGEPFYFATPVASGAPGHNDGHSKAKAETVSDAIKDLIATMEATNCTFNLSVIDRCLSSSSFLSTIPSDDKKVISTENLFHALQNCVSADAECQRGETSSGEKEQAAMNENCEGILTTIEHCLLDDRHVNNVWSTLNTKNLVTLKDTPLPASLYECVQKNVFCEKETQSTHLSSEGHEQAKDQESSASFDPLAHCDKDNLACIAHVKLHAAKHAARAKPRLRKRQSVGDRREDTKAAQPFDWSRLYPDMENIGKGRVPPVVGPTPVSEWPVSKTQDSGRLPPVVGPTPFSDWDSMRPFTPPSKPHDMIPPSLARPQSSPSANTSQTQSHNIIYSPPPLNNTNPPPLVSNTTTTMPTSTTPSHETPTPDTPDTWRDGVFPFPNPNPNTARTTLESAPQPSRPHASPDAPATTTAVDEAVDEAEAEDKGENDDNDILKALSSLFPFLAPGPVLPAGNSLPPIMNTTPATPAPPRAPQAEEEQQKKEKEKEKEQEGTRKPSNLDSTPSLINDLAPADEEAVRAFFNSLMGVEDGVATSSVAGPTSASI